MGRFIFECAFANLFIIKFSLFDLFVLKAAGGGFIVAVAVFGVADGYPQDLLYGVEVI